MNKIALSWNNFFFRMCLSKKQSLFSLFLGCVCFFFLKNLFFANWINLMFCTVDILPTSFLSPVMSLEGAQRTEMPTEIGRRIVREGGVFGISKYGIKSYCV